MNLIDIPPNEDFEEEYDSPKSRGYGKLLVKLGIGIFVGISITFSLAGSITLGSGQAFELGLRNYDVGTCADDLVQVIPKTSITETGTALTQFTISGINPITCEGRVIRILPFDNSGTAIPLIDTTDAGSTPDQTYVDIFVSAGQFLANLGESATVTTVSTLNRTNGATQIFRSLFSSDSSTVAVYSAGLGRTLKSSEDDLSGLAISFQVRISPAVYILFPSSYGRTDLELRAS